MHETIQETMPDTVKVLSHDESTHTSTVSDWSMAQVLKEINRDHSAEFDSYNSHDWKDGWAERVFPEHHQLAEDVQLISHKGKSFVIVAYSIYLVPQAYEVINPSDLNANDPHKDKRTKEQTISYFRELSHSFALDAHRVDRTALTHSTVSAIRAECYELAAFELDRNMA